jgi:hypothetical protein
MHSLDELISSSDTLVIAQKPTPAAWDQMTASGLAILDLTKLEVRASMTTGPLAKL